MKKLALTSLLAVFAFSGAHAATNYFVGGGANMSLNDDHNTVLAIAPEFGYKYNSDWDLGFGAHFGYAHHYTPDVAAYAGDAYSYGAGVFARYKVAQFGGVKLLLKGSVDANFVTLSPDDDDLDNETYTKLTAGIVPMVTYDITPAFTLYANLDFLRVGADYTFENDKLNIDDSWHFGANVDAGNVANTGSFQIGFNYNF